MSGWKSILGIGHLLALAAQSYPLSNPERLSPDLPRDPLPGYA
jgi:hypothetical protein